MSGKEKISQRNVMKGVGRRVLSLKEADEAEEPVPPADADKKDEPTPPPSNTPPTAASLLVDAARKRPAGSIVDDLIREMKSSTREKK